MAFEMLPGSLRLKTTTVPANYKLVQLEPILIDKHRKGRRKKGAKLHSQKLLLHNLYLVWLDLGTPTRHYSETTRGPWAHLEM